MSKLDIAKLKIVMFCIFTSIVGFVLATVAFFASYPNPSIPPGTYVLFTDVLVNDGEG